MRSLRLGSVGILLLLGLTLAPGVRSEGAEAESVSMVRLLANPATYDGKRIRTEGFVVVAHEESVIYLSKEHADFVITENGLWLDFSGSPFIPQEYDQSYVSVEGTFDGTRGGTWALSPSVLRSVTDIKRIQRRGEKSAASG